MSGNSLTYVLLTLPWIVVGGNQNISPILVGDGVYPRGIRLSDGTTLVCAGLKIFQGYNNNLNWTQLGTFAARGANEDVGNCFLYEWKKTGLLYASYRHHTGCASECKHFSIQMAVSKDKGKTWRYLSTVVNRTIGVWEPYLIEAQGKLWVAYSQEKTNGGLQSIVWQPSIDAVTWGIPQIISDGTEHNSRDGMPGIARVSDTTLIVVFEGFWAYGHGHFSVQARRSFDDGRTWTQGAVIFSDAKRNAGSPQVAICENSLPVVTFMFQESNSHKWPMDAGVALMFGYNNASQGQPLQFNQTSLKEIAIGPGVQWPSLFNTDHIYAAYSTLSGVSLIEGPIC
eukprot:m.343291 g.343291  ORF g.343291 m.343291 type:complete len:341 (-) comp22649_c0_seq1:3-1025(-)